MDLLAEVIALRRNAVPIGAEIRRRRRAAGFTQVAFARALGISVHTLRNWETGRRRPKWAAQPPEPLR